MPESEVISSANWGNFLDSAMTAVSKAHQHTMAERNSRVGKKTHFRNWRTFMVGVKLRGCDGQPTEYAEGERSL